MSSPFGQKEENPVFDEKIPEDEILDLTLRPKSWDEYIGQERIKKSIKVIIEAAKQRKESPEHILLYGSSGLGKTSLANLVAGSLGTNIKITSGPAIERMGDLAAILTNLNDGDVFFIDEIHRLNKIIEEYLYPAMEEFKLNLVLGKGPMARTMEMNLNRFTLIGATTKLALLSSPLRSRFGATFRLNFYTEEEIEKIIQRSANLLKVEIEREAVKTIAKRSRSIPRIANRLLKRVRDFAQVEKNNIITKEITEKTLKFLEIDELGLEFGERKLLEVIIHKFNGGPVALKALSAISSEEEETILEIYEPYLIKCGFIERTPRGRVVTKLAYRHLNIKISNRDAQQKIL